MRAREASWCVCQPFLRFVASMQVDKRTVLEVRRAWLAVWRCMHEVSMHLLRRLGLHGGRTPWIAYHSFTTTATTQGEVANYLTISVSIRSSDSDVCPAQSRGRPQ